MANGTTPSILAATQMKRLSPDGPLAAAGAIRPRTRRCAGTALAGRRDRRRAAPGSAGGWDHWRGRSWRLDLGGRGGRSRRDPLADVAAENGLVPLVGH